MGTTGGSKLAQSDTHLASMSSCTSSIRFIFLILGNTHISTITPTTITAARTIKSDAPPAIQATLAPSFCCDVSSSCRLPKTREEKCAVMRRETHRERLEREIPSPAPVQQCGSGNSNLEVSLQSIIGSMFSNGGRTASYVCWHLSRTS